MKILFITIGNQQIPSSRTRVYQYIPHLEKENVKTKIINYRSGSYIWLAANFTIRKYIIFKYIYLLISYLLKMFEYFIFQNIQTFRMLLFAKRYDIIFLQKVVFPCYILFILKKINNNIVFDFDDAIYADKKMIFSKKNFDITIISSKLVFIENENTKKYVEKLGVHSKIITGPIDCDRYYPKSIHSNNEIIFIGWIGSFSTTYYLNIVLDVLKALSKKYNKLINIELIGANNFIIENVKINNNIWSLNTEIELLHKFDIGIMPLYDDEYSRGKGGYKLLQYMALGIPSVVSSVGINKDISIHCKTGFLASTSEEWYKYLEILIINSNKRKEMGDNARKRAFEEYSFQKSTKIFIDELIKIKGKFNDQKKYRN